MTAGTLGRRDATRPWLWRVWVDLAAPWAVVVVLASTTGSSGLGPAITMWWAFLAWRLAAAPTSRPLTAFVAAFTLYGTSAWIAASRFGLVYPPGPTDETIIEGTRLTLFVVIGTFVALRLIPLDLSTDWLRQAGVDVLDRASMMASTRVLLVAASLSAIALRDWWSLRALGLDAVLAADRRAFADVLATASDHNVQIVGIAGTIALGAVALSTPERRHRALAMALVIAAFWGPSLLVGARKSPLIVLVALALLTLAAARGRPVRRGPLVVATVLAVGLLLVPLARTGRLDQATIEFVYPQYVLFAAMEHDLDLDYGYARGAALMLPAALRPFDVTDIGSSFGALGVTNVGVGAHPVGEAYLASAGAAAGLAVAATVLAVVIVRLLASIDATSGLAGVAHLVLWGRSDFWIALFFTVYVGVVLWLLLSGARRPPRGPLTGRQSLL